MYTRILALFVLPAGLGQPPLLVKAQPTFAGFTTKPLSQCLASFLEVCLFFVPILFKSEIADKDFVTGCNWVSSFQEGSRTTFAIQ